MAEVYRARDTQLRRDVAIEVLPASVAGDAARLARFEPEALATGRGGDHLRRRLRWSAVALAKAEAPRS
jgi:hypothetical protein